MTGPASDEIAGLIQGLRSSAELPKRAAECIDALRRTGVELTHASVYLQNEAGSYDHCVLLPPPVTWDRATLPSAAHRAEAPHVITTVGADVVQLAAPVPGALAEPELRWCATHLAMLARRAHDLRALEEARSQLGKLDKGLIRAKRLGYKESHEMFG